MVNGNFPSGARREIFAELNRQTAFIADLVNGT
jgi:hypothetical protein